MNITIKHNIKREGCTLSGQILDCKFSGGAERGDNVRYYSKDKELLLQSSNKPELCRYMFFVWGSCMGTDLNTISYTYPTEQEAQDMLDFLNTFVETVF